MTAPTPRSTLPPISDELLSAYLDGQVTAAESTRVEQAQAEDTDIAVRLHMLEQTVDLLRQTPRLAAPRSFVLSEAQVLAAGGRVKAGSAAPRSGGFWAWLGAFSPRTMPLATAAVAVALLLVIGIDLGGNRMQAPVAAPEAAMVTESAAAAEPMQMSVESTANEAAPAAEENAELRSMAAEATPEAEPTPAAKMATSPDEIASAQTEITEDAAAPQAMITEAEVAPPATPSFRWLEYALAALVLLLLALTVLSRKQRTA